GDRTVSRLQRCCPRWPPRAARGLSSDLEGASFANDRDTNLTRILKGFLDLLGDVPGQANGPEIIDLLRFDNNTHFAACLDCEALLDALERVRNLLQRLEALDVVLDALVPGARPRPADGVRGLHDHGFETHRFRIRIVVLDDGVNHAL